MIVMFVVKRRLYSPIIIMTHVFNLYLSMHSPLQIGGDIIYVLICFMTDPPEQQANCRSLPCEPLLSDDGRGIEDLDEGQLKEQELGHPLTMSHS